MLEGLLLWGGVIAGPLFIVIFLVEGYLRKGYNPLRQPVSTLSIGPRGWVQQANFFVSSILLLACAFGLHSILIGLYAAGLFGAGLFVTDTTGMHEGGSKPVRSRNGVLHDLFSLIVFASLAAACFVFAHLFAGAGERGWELYSIVTGVLYITGFLLFARGFGLEKGTLASAAGLLQRLTISLGAIWLSLVAAHILGIF
jgi:hypothetical protein